MALHTPKGMCLHDVVTGYLHRGMGFRNFVLLCGAESKVPEG